MKRVQQKRGKKLPPNTKSVARGSRWGNSHKICPGMTREQAVANYKADLEAMPKAELEIFLAPLRGCDIACYCDLDKICHVDVIIEFMKKVFDEK